MQKGKEKSPKFRTEALLFYIERQEMPVYPKLVSPRGFALFWLLLGAIVTISLLILTVKTPVHVQGLAVPTASDTDGARVLTVFVSAEYSAYLSAGKEVLLETDVDHSLSRFSITSVEPSTVGLSQVVKQFGISEQSASRIKYPAVIAIARPAPLSGWPDADSPNEAYDVRIEVGHQRAISHINPIDSQLQQTPR